MSLFKNKEKYLIPQDLLYDLYTNLSNSLNKKVVNKHKYRAFINDLIKKKYKLIYNINKIDPKTTELLISNMNTAQIELGGILFICIVPWYDFSISSFRLDQMK